MTQDRILTNLRRLTGNLDPNAISDRDLSEYVESASDWLAIELANFYSIEELMLGLTADESEIALPDDLAWILFIEWNNNRLEGSSHFQSDRSGIGYRQLTSGNPNGFLVIGRKLILVPPPSSASVTADANLTIRYVSMAPAMTTGGIPGLSDADCRLMLARASWEYWGNHMEVEGAADRMVFAEKQMASLLPAAKARTDRPVLDQGPRWWPQISRQGSAR
jgi:hypothetical protein